MPDHSGFTGSRNHPTVRQVAWLAASMRDVLHHGVCVGSDHASHQVALQLGRRIVAHPPSVEKLMARECLASAHEIRKPKWYHDRNRDIVNESAHLLALPDGPERPNSGTWYTINYAVEQRKPVYICYPDGVVEHRLWVDFDNGGGHPHTCVRRFKPPTEGPHMCAPNDGTTPMSDIRVDALDDWDEEPPEQVGPWTR